MVLSKNMQKLVAGSSTIRKLFEEGIELAKEVGAENVYDFSLGNPNVPAPQEVEDSILETLKEEDSKTEMPILYTAICQMPVIRK